MRKLLIITLFTLISSQLFGQPWMKIDSVFAPSGLTVQSFSAPFLADMDADGDLDMWLGNSGGKTEYYENIVNTPYPKFRRNEQMMQGIYPAGVVQVNSDYPVVADIDGDSDLDLVIGGYNGLILYFNIGTPIQALWQRNDSVLAGVNTEIGTDPKPAFVDIDGDGDLDLYVGIGESLFGGPQSGITIAFRNTGTATSPQFTRDNSLATGIADMGYNAYPTFADLDNDGDKDLTLGRDLATMVYYRNNGNNHAPVWNEVSGFYGALESTRYWKDPQLVDIDGDGDFDLLYGTDVGVLYMYHNTGSVTSPQFMYNKNYYPVLKIEGSGATASVGDWDKDGDLDLVSGMWDGRIFYFRNIGTPGAPVYDKQTVFALADAGSYSTPVIVDFEGDDTLDIISGNLNGEVKYFKRTGAMGLKEVSYFPGITAGGQSVISCPDVNNDGHKDLFVGSEKAANNHFYFYTSPTTGTPADSVIAGIGFSSWDRSQMVDLNRDGIYEMVIGKSNGTLVYWEKTGAGWKRNDTLFAGVKVNQNAFPAFADLDNDGKTDIIVAEYNGNFSFYKNMDPTVGVQDDAPAVVTGFALEQNYPNPFNAQTVIRFSVPEKQFVRIALYNTLGELVRTVASQMFGEGAHQVFIDAAGLPSGVYFYSLESSGYQQTKKMVVLR